MRAEPPPAPGLHPAAKVEALDEPAAGPPRPPGRLSGKYVGLIVGLVGGALLLSGGLEIYFSYEENKAALAQIQQEKALAAAGRIEQFVDEIERQIGWTTRAQWTPALMEQRRFDYLQLLRQAPALTEVAHLSAAGKEQLCVSRLAMDVIDSGADFSNQPQFVEAKTKKTWTSPVYFRKESEPHMTLALAGSGHDSGITVAEVNLKFIWDVITRIKVGERGYAYVIDASGFLIAHPDIGLVLRKTDLSALPQVKAAREMAQGALNDSGQVLVGADPQGRAVLTARATIAPLGWTVLVDLPLAEALAPLYASLWRTVALLALGLAVSVVAALLLARRVVGPIRLLQEGAARIGAGEFGHRIGAASGDEMQTLADQFNRMAGRLEESYTGLERKVAERTAELEESLQQQTATADVLKVISRSTFDLEAVLDSLVATAVRLCHADKGHIFRYVNDRFELAAGLGYSPEWKAYFDANPMHIDRGSAVGRAILDGGVVQIPDCLADPEYEREFHEVGDFRTVLAVPLLREGRPVGVFGLTRREVRPFHEREIELVTTFADQAVIAIENVRLLDELQTRSAELARSVEELTATSEVLRVISRSTFDLQPVLDTVVETAARLCRADKGNIFRLLDGRLEFASAFGYTLDFAEFVTAHPLSCDRGSVTGRAILEGHTVHVTDVLADPEYTITEHRSVGDFRTALAVPLFREGKPIGAISLTRRGVDPFTDRQIELVTTFADQAAIAIENVRLLEELQARKDELARSVEELTATSDVLKVISRSAFDLQAVLDTLTEAAARLCDADMAGITRPDLSGHFYHATNYNFPPDWVEFTKTFSMQPGRSSVVGRALLACRPVQVADVLADPEYTYIGPAKKAGYRTFLAVPLMRDATPIGVITLGRRPVRAFTDKQVALVSTFADQAVIAIENARLLDELQSRSAELARSVEELQALSEIGQTVSATLDLKKVLETIVTNAVEISGTDAGAIYDYDEIGDEFRLQATINMSEELKSAITAAHIRMGETLVGEAAVHREPRQIADIAAETDIPLRDELMQAGFRAILVVPLIREDRVLGALIVRRKTPGHFDDDIVNRLQTFAAQSALAVQNARLFAEIEEKGRQLEAASRHKSEFLANMSHELRTPLNAVLGYAELIQDNVYGELPERVYGVLSRIQANGRHLLGLINDVLDLSKIEAGQLKLSLGEYSMKDVVYNVISATESLASEKGLALRAELAPDLPMGRGDERRLVQVILNLVGNAIKFTDEGGVTVSGAAGDGIFTVSVSDTGPGIATADQARIFEEFQQVDSSSTKKKGGTGLGLSIAKRIIELHGGRIWVESEPGQGATFAVAVPVRVEKQVGAG